MTLRLSPRALLTQNGERRYATDMESGRLYELNPTAWDIAKAIEAGMAPEALEEAIAARHPGIPRVEIARDVSEMVAELGRLGLLAGAGGKVGGAHPLPQPGDPPGGKAAL